MKLIIPSVLVILLVGLSVFTVYEYVLNQQLAAENTRLKDQLTSQAAQLQTLDAEKLQLQRQLNETDVRVAELENKTATLEQEIQKLRDQLRRESYITIGLTFLWNGNVSVQRDTISSIVERMNDVIWDKFQVYFFVYHAEPMSYIPQNYSCSNYYITGSRLGIAWGDAAWKAYPGPAIPIGIFADVDHNAFWGCEMNSTEEYAVAIYAGALADTREASQLLSHELLHVFGFSDDEIDKQMGNYVDVIPSAWLPQIQAQAKRFQMKPPS
jgi:cell division protein FtsB